LMYDNSKKFNTNSEGIQIHGKTYAEGDIDMPDSAKLLFGNSDDLTLHHDGSHSYITSETGELYIDVNAGSLRIESDSSWANGKMAHFIRDGSVDLYYDGSKKLETTSTGIAVTGNVVPSGYISLVDNGKLYIGTSNDMQIFHDGSYNYVYGSTPVYVQSNTVELQSQGGEKYLKATANNEVELYYNGSKKLETNNEGIEVFDTVKSTGNRGSAYAFAAYSTTTTGTQYYMTFRRSDDTHDGYIVSSSDGAISLAQGSDYRLKENIVSMTNGIDIVKKLNPVTYKFKGKTDTLQGFIAHEVDDAGILNGVIGTKDAVDSDGKPIYQGLSVDKLIPALTAALKEAITKIETLETKVAALEAK